MAERKKRKSDRSGRPPMRSPGRPTVARREDQQRFWAATPGVLVSGSVRVVLRRVGAERSGSNAATCQEWRVAA